MTSSNAFKLSCKVDYRSKEVEDLIREFDRQMREYVLKTRSDPQLRNDTTYVNEMTKFVIARRTLQAHQKNCTNQGACIYSYGRFLWDHFSHLIEIPDIWHKRHLFTRLYYFT